MSSNSKSEDTPIELTPDEQEMIKGTIFDPSKGSKVPPQENCGTPHIDENYGLMNCNLLKGHDGEHYTMLIGSATKDNHRPH